MSTTSSTGARIPRPVQEQPRPRGLERFVYLSIQELQLFLEHSSVFATRASEAVELTRGLFFLVETAGAVDNRYALPLGSTSTTQFIRAQLAVAEREGRLIYRSPAEPVLSLKRFNGLLARWGYPRLHSVDSYSDSAEDGFLGVPSMLAAYNQQLAPRLTIREFFPVLHLYTK